MTELKIYESEHIITHELGEDFNNQIDALISLWRLENYRISSWCSAKIELGGHHVLSVNDDNDALFNFVFKVDDKAHLRYTSIYDHRKKVQITNDVIDYCYKIISEE